MKKLLFLILMLCTLFVNAQCFTETSAGGDNFSLAIKPDGTLWAWGYNGFGTIGDGTTVRRLSPVQIGTATNWVKVAAGEQNSIALKSDGTLWAWGTNTFGQLGDGSTFDRIVPTQVGTASNWASCAMGSSHCIALKTDGTLWAWGNGASGELGNGLNNQSLVPIQIGAATDWLKIYANNRFTFAIKSNGTLWAWGVNNVGQLGIGSTTNVNVPTQIGSGTNWMSVALSRDYTVALKTDGTLWSWGGNYFGGLGNGTVTSTNAPAQIGTATDWSTISGGNYHSIALKANGTLWAWGYNNGGRLGDGTTTNRLAPTQIGTATNWNKIAANEPFNIGYTITGDRFAWGFNDQGQFGNGTLINSNVPIVVGTCTPPPASSLNFDGVNDRVALPRFDFSGNDKLTVEAWIKPTNITTKEFYEIARQQNPPAAPDFLVSFQANGAILSFGLNTTNGGYNELDVPITASQFTDGNWHHVAVVYDGVTKKIYKDGVLIGTQNKTGNIIYNASSSNFIGFSPESTIEAFDGNIDEVHFWNRALQQCEIVNNMTGELPSSQTNLYAYYKFNQGVTDGSNATVTTLNDSSGNNLNGTLNNFALTGTTSNWTSPGGVVLGTNAPLFTDLSATVSSTDVTTCFGGSNGTAMVTASGGFGAYTYLWSPSGGTDATASGLSSGNYSCTITSSGCSVVKNITINQPVVINAPLAIANQVYAGSGTIANLSVSGSGIQWYASLTGGIALANNTALVDGTTYYASQTVSGCESPTRVSVAVRKISEATQTFCSPATVANLISTPSAGSTASWFTNASGGMALPSATTLTSGTYYVQPSVPILNIFGFASNSPFGIANDAAGNIYAANNSAGTIVKMNPDGSNQVIVASGFTNPLGIALDNTGNIFVSDSGNNSIKKVNTSGTVTTIGTGFNNPFGLTVGSDGTVYVADNDNNLVKKINPTYTTITTISSGLVKPLGIDIDNSGNLYVTYFGTNTIRKMDTNGNNMVTLVSGLQTPRAVAVAPNGDIIYTSSSPSEIYKMNPDGSNQTLIATLSGQPAGFAFGISGEIYVSSPGGSYIRRLAGETSNRVPVTITITPSTENVTTVSTCNSYTWANNGTTYNTSGTYTGTTTNCVTEKLNLTITPSSDNVTVATACDSYTWANTNQTYTSSGVYTGTTTNCVTEKLDLTIIHTIQPSAIATQVYVGSATLADLTVTGTNIKWYNSATSGMLLPTTTSLVDGITYYASQTVSGCESPTRVAVAVKRISETTQTLCETNATVGNLIATPSSGYTANWFTSATGGASLAGSTALTSGTYYVEQSNASSSIIGSGFSYPYGVAIDAVGNIYVADSANNAIKKMDANGNNIVTLGSGFNLPFGIALDTAGNIYVADSQNNVIKKMDPTGTTITTIGTGFNNPFSLSVDAAGNVFVADNDNNLVKKINSTYTSITTLGSGFVKPLGIDVDAAGNIYVTDFGSNTIKKMDSNGNNIITLATTTSLPRGVTVGPQGEIVFSQGNGEIRSMDANGNNQVVLGVQPEPTGLAFNPSGVLHLASTSSSSIRKLTGTTSNRVSVTIVVNPLSNNTTTISVCDSYTWANNGQTYTASGTYTGTTTNCVTEILDLTILIQVQPSATATQVYAGSATLADLTVNGTNIKWYDAETAGTLLPSTTGLVDGTTYYASQTVSGCESPTRVSVAVTRISETTQTFCSPATVDDLVSTPSSGFTANWFTDSTAGNPLSSSDILSTGTYYVEQTMPLSNVIISSDFNGPYAFAIEADGKIVVSDGNTNTIKRMNADGSNLQTIASGFNFPFGVAIQADGKIIVADWGNSVIKRMDADGSNIITLATGFSRPAGVAIQADGKIVVTDFNNNNVKRFDADGSNIITLGSGFTNPIGVAIQADDKIIVVDSGNNAIKRMDENGANIVTLGSGFSIPYGVAVQADGKIIIAGYGDGAVKRMNEDGSNIITLGSGFSGPSAVAIETDGKIVVADVNTNQIRRITEESSLSNRVAVDVIITPSTENVTTVSTCNSYTWANNETTYNTSGTYAGTTTNCVTEKLNLTITPSTTNTTTISSVGAYYWTANEETYTTSGNYTYVNGCDTQILNLTIIPIDITTTIVNNVITANQSGATYQWNDCTLSQPILSEINQSYTATINGSYSVTIFINGVQADSNCETVSVLSSDIFNENSNIKLSPNPSSGIFFIQIPTESNIEIYNSLGQLIMTKEMNSGINSIDISDKSEGIYFLKAKIGNEVSNFKIIKKD